MVAFSATLTKDKQLVHGEVVEFDDITRNDGQWTDLFDPFLADFSLFLKLQTQKKFTLPLWEIIFILSLLLEKVWEISVGNIVGIRLILKINSHEWEK